MNLCNYDEIKALLGRHGFHFSKSLGQNFLIDPDVPYDIAASSMADETCGVLEIGPGIGPLTEQLAKRASKVVSIELDSALLPVLAETMTAYPNVEIIHGDVLKSNLNALVADKFQGLTPIVCANLPYNITSPVLAKLVETTALETFTVLIQREVAQRICAKQGDSDGGSFSLFMQYYMETEVLFDVAPDRFLPAPKVTSSVLRCVRRKNPAVEVEDETFFFKVMRGAFLLRRKTLCNSLASALPKVEKAHVAAALVELGLSENIRGERLTLQNFADLAKILSPYQ